MSNNYWGGWEPISPDEIEREERDAKRELIRAYRLVAKNEQIGEYKSIDYQELIERADAIERELEVEE